MVGHLDNASCANIEKLKKIIEQFDILKKIMLNSTGLKDGASYEKHWKVIATYAAGQIFFILSSQLKQQ